ncbi:MAG: SDR family oxidoreductase [Geminicoccaceae bacterium]
MSETRLPKTPSFRLDGRRALVTGAGRGIGRAAACALAEAGAHVVLASRSAGELEELAKDIRETGGSAEPLCLDAADVEAVRAAIDPLEGFHVLVNNAGANRPQPFLDVTVENYDAVTDLNVRGAFFTAQAVARGMVRDGVAGSIINISSQMGHVGGANRSVYCATKHAIEGLTRVLAVELAEHGIRANTLCPTFIETPMTAPFLADPGFRKNVLEKIVLGRTGKVEDLMGAILFLASDASALMTGSSLLVDGGWTAS